MSACTPATVIILIPSPSSNLFAYREPGSVNSISPSTGQYGTKVNVSGLRFDDGEGIRIITVAGVQADIESSTSTSVIVTLQRPSQLGSFEGQVVIESNQGTITQSCKFSLTFKKASLPHSHPHKVREEQE